MQVAVGDYVAWDLADDGSAIAVGIVEKVLKTRAHVREAHAFHQMWGGSAAERGAMHSIRFGKLRSCPSAYRQLCKTFHGKLIAA